MNRPHRWTMGCIFVVFCIAIVSPAQTYTVLSKFEETNGDSPLGSLIQATDGDFYGTTWIGGAYGFGTIFKITAEGTLTTLYSFCAQSGCPNGDEPYSGLVQGTDGNFYGTTNFGGAYGQPYEGGTVFKITPGGTLTTLYSFCLLACPEGRNPEASLVQGTDGDFYGTTHLGGPNLLSGGTVFKITSEGTLTTLYAFCSRSSCSDGQGPAGLVQATDGNFYGTTISGGRYHSGRHGTVFKITPDGIFRTLYSFCLQTNCADGSRPAAGLVQGLDGDLYGTTLYGGASNLGTVFKITASGTLTTLHSFASSDGAGPGAPLVQATDGNFYGTTAYGAKTGFGTIFKITPGGTLTTLHIFDSPYALLHDPAGLVQATDGNFYGTTLYSGSRSGSCSPYGCGTVFRLSVGLSPSTQ